MRKDFAVPHVAVYVIVKEDRQGKQDEPADDGYPEQIAKAGTLPRRITTRYTAARSEVPQ